MFKLTVRRRILLLLLIVSLIPLALINVIWFYASQSNLKHAAINQQVLLVKSSAESVNNFINGKIDTAIIHSQTPALQGSLANAQTELAVYLKQDQDVEQITLVDAKGQQRMQMNRTSNSTEPVDLSSKDVFRVVSFLSGSEYISPVQFSANHEPFITISVPLLNYTNTQTGRDLSTAEPGIIRMSSDIKGAMIIDVALKSLWNEVLASKLGRSGYAYVVDDKGNLIAHPQSEYLLHHRLLDQVPEVQAAIRDNGATFGANYQPQPHQTLSETSVPVLSSHFQIARTHWTVVAEEPIKSVYARAADEIRVAILFFILSALTGISIILVTARSLLHPIRLLTEGAARVSAGDLHYRIALNRHDEFGVLARTVNQMADTLRSDIEKLQEVDQLKTEFIMIASHNLRTPLTIINGYLELMKDRQVPENLRKMINSIQSSAQSLSTFSEDLLTISTIEAGTAKLNSSDISLRELLIPLQEEYSSLVSEKNIEVHWFIPDLDTIVHLSPTHIRSALNNLFRNAVKFTEKGGRIELTFEIQPNQYIISVHDTGVGIKPEEMNKLFTKFHRGTSTTQYDYSGTGIGLYATRLIVESHGGHIGATSTVGLGSIFTITLPIPITSESSAEN